MNEKETLLLYPADQVDALARFIHFRGCELRGNEAAPWERAVPDYRDAMLELARQVFLEMHDVVVGRLLGLVINGHGPVVMVGLDGRMKSGAYDWLKELFLERA